MLASRAALRATRTARVQPILRTAPRRLQSTSTPQTSSNYTPGIVGGLIGGGIVTILGYSYYHYSGASTFINTASAARTKFEAAFKKSTETAPKPNEAIQWLRATATSYAGFIPGAKGYVDSAFDDIDAIQQKHGDEVNKIVEDAYVELKDVGKQGMSMDTVTKVWDVLQVRDTSLCWGGGGFQSPT